MTGRYLIYTPVESVRDEKRFDAAWRRFAETCRSLYRDGLIYNVQFNLTEAIPHVLITASGKAVPRKQPAARRFQLSQPISRKRCRERVDEARWFLPEFRERRKDGTLYWGRHRDRYRELSELAEEHVRADFEFWRELELLSGQREHFKPGRTDETANLDDQVAA